MSVLAFAEQRDGTLRQTALEAVTAGRQLADRLGVELVAVLLGPPSLSAATEELGRHGADRVLTGYAEAFAGYAPEGYAEVVARAARENEAKAIVFSASAQGKDLAPRVAARLKAALASDVTEVGIEDGRVVATRPAYAGKVFLRVAFKDEPALVSVRPGALRAAEAPREATVAELSVEEAAGSARCRVELAAGEKKGRPDVAEAEIIVSGGRGLGGPENWNLLEALADALGPGTALGASRAVVDAGWRPHAEQVGQTGKVVAPPLYFALGISGAIQHLAGMQTAGCIVAVNKDPEAPIFKIADFGIVGDLFEIVPRLTDEIKKARDD